MTISTSSSQTTIGGNNATTTFNFSFIAGVAANIQVIYTDATNTQKFLFPSQYTLIINAPVAGQIWGVGGSVTYPIIGSPISNGTSLTIRRIVPLTQTTSISNQGDFYPQVVETAMDTLCMEIQQLAARTTQFQGTWITNTIYNVGDIVQDGINGSNTNNYYICIQTNTSGTWATDLVNGDWALSVSAIVPVGNTILFGDVTGSGPASHVPTTLATVNSNVGSFTAANITVDAKGRITAAANGGVAYINQLTGDITAGPGSGSVPTTLATVNSNVGSFTAANITVDAKGRITAAANGATYPAAATGTLSGASTTFTVDFTTYSTYGIFITSAFNNVDPSVCALDVSSNGGSSYVTATFAIATVLGGIFWAGNADSSFIGFLTQNTTTGKAFFTSTSYGQADAAGGIRFANNETIYSTTAAINRIRISASTSTFSAGNVRLQPISLR